jgi:hypothetical protein
MLERVNVPPSYRHHEVKLSISCHSGCAGGEATFVVTGTPSVLHGRSEIFIFNSFNNALRKQKGTIITLCQESYCSKL